MRRKEKTENEVDRHDMEKRERESWALKMKRLKIGK